MLGEVYRARSIIGSEFVCHVARKTTVAGRPAIAPVISGRAWITGVHQHMLDPTDPWPSWLPAGRHLAAAHNQKSYLKKRVARPSYQKIE